MRTTRTSLPLIKDETPPVAAPSEITPEQTSLKDEVRESVFGNAELPNAGKITQLVAANKTNPEITVAIDQAYAEKGLNLGEKRRKRLLDEAKEAFYVVYEEYAEKLTYAQVNHFVHSWLSGLSETPTGVQRGLKVGAVLTVIGNSPTVTASANNAVGVLKTANHALQLAFDKDPSTAPSYLQAGQLISQEVVNAVRTRAPEIEEDFARLALSTLDRKVAKGMY
jgi:hypothetical protein